MYMLICGDLPINILYMVLVTSVAETGGDQQGPGPPLTPLIYSLIFMNSENFANFALTGPPQLANLGNPASAIALHAYEY
jgi:hypothetical protein